MNPTGFELALPGRISFGIGAGDQVAGIVAALGRRVLVVTGSDPTRFQHLIGSVRALVDAVAVVSLATEPGVTDARRAVAAARGIEADVLLAIGGGSAIDLAKATGMLLANGGDPMDYIEVVGAGRPITRESIPVVAVPTTAGTGAEVTANAVLVVSEHEVKASLRHPSMLPRHAVIDPALTLGCSPAVTAAAGMDALTQNLEPLVSVRANPVTDAWARAGLAAAGRGLVAAYRDGQDLSARSEMALCALLGGLSLANAKLGVVHGFAGVLGGMTSAAHGALCAALLAPACRANLRRADPALRARFTEAAVCLTGEPGASAEAGLDWIETTVTTLGIPGLSAHGFGPEQTAAVVAATARASSTAGNPMVLDQDELAEVYLAAL